MHSRSLLSLALFLTLHFSPQARVCSPRKGTDKGEANATSLSDAIPFLEYDLHQQLLYKLKVQSQSLLSRLLCVCLSGI